MQIAVLADEVTREELLSKKIPEQTGLVWADSVRSLTMIEADAYLDLLFAFDHERIAKLKVLLPRPVLVNSVIHTTRDISQPFVRVNAWPTMLKRDLTELSAGEGYDEAQVREVGDALGWNCHFVPDIVGMITPRIIAMIINEAWFTAGAGVSSREEIDTAMKLGTNYPFGPFEWSEKIGPDHIRSLLLELSRTDSRYTIAPALLNHG